MALIPFYFALRCRPVLRLLKAALDEFRLSVWSCCSRPPTGRPLLAGSTRSSWLTKAVNHWPQQTNRDYFLGLDRNGALGQKRSSANVGSSDCCCQQRTHTLDLSGRLLHLCDRPLAVGMKIWTARVTAMGNSLGDRMSSGSSLGPTQSGRCSGYPNDIPT